MAVVLSLTDRQKTALIDVLGSTEVPSMKDPDALNQIYVKLHKQPIEKIEKTEPTLIDIEDVIQ